MHANERANEPATRGVYGVIIGAFFAVNSSK